MSAEIRPRNLQTVRELVDHQAVARPQAVLAVDTESQAALSFGDLAGHLTSIDAWLTEAGASMGSTVAVVMPNGLGTLRLLLGAMATGRCVVPVNLLSQADVLRHVLDHSDCSLVVCVPEWQERVAAALALINRPLALRLADPQALTLDGERPSAASGTAPPSPVNRSLTSPLSAAVMEGPTPR